MTNSTTLVKKAFSVAVAATTILWSVGLSAFLPSAASAASFGDLIKGTSLSTVYYFGSNGQRYAFPNEKTYFSWYKDFSTVKTISDSELASITLAGNIVYRPGARWIKITSDNKVYVTTPAGKIRWVENEATAKGLAGDNWNAHIDDVADVFFTDYTVGDSLTSAVSGYDGMLWSDGTTKYLVSGTKYQKVTDAGFVANRYNAGFVLMGTGFTKSGLTAGADITVAMANLTDTAQKVTTATYSVSQNVSVALSASSPAASTLIAGQAIANVMALDFTNPTASPVSVKSIKLARTGVSSDNTLSNVYLFSGYVRLSDSASVSSGTITWNDAAGLFTIPAGGTVTVNVRTDVAASTSGQTLGLKLNAAADVAFVGAFAATGSFPLMSATHTVAAAPSSFGTVSFAATTNPTGDAAPSPENDFKVWENNVTVGNNSNGAWLQSIRFRNIGSINADDINNWRLYVGGVQKGSAVAKQDANGYVTFDLSAAPVKLTTNTHTFKVLADVIGGSTRTVSVSLRSAADAVFTEFDYQQPILVQANNTTFSARNAAAQTIAAGDVTFTKRADSPSGDLITGATGATLARFDVKASGEPVKIESLNFNIAEGDNDTNYALRNGAIYMDGVQIGNTTAICGDYEDTAATCTSAGGSGASYTTFNFGSSLVVYPGTPVVLEVRADIYDTQGSANVPADKTIQVAIDATTTTTGNVLRKTSGSYIVRPASGGQDVVGNSMTVKSGSITVLKNGSYANQTIVVPKVGYKVGSWTISTTTTEAIDLNTFSVNFDGGASEGGVADAADDYTNLYIEYGLVGGTMTTATTKPTVAATNSFSVNTTLAAGKTLVLNAYADIASGASDGVDSADFLIADLDVAGTATGAGTVSQSDKDGQTITFFNAGTFTPILDGSTPSAFITAGNQTVTAAKFRVSALNEAYTVKEMTFTVGSAAIASTINRVELYDGETLLGSSVFDQSAGAGALVTGMNLPIAAGAYKVVTAKLVLNPIGAGAGASQSNAALTLTTIKKADSQGVQSTNGSLGLAGNTMHVYKAIPVVKHVNLTNSTLVNGQAVDLYKFTVTASGGDIALKQMKFPLNWSDGLGASETTGTDTLGLDSVKFFKNGVDITTSVVIQDQGTGDAESTGNLTEADSTLAVIFDTAEESISSGTTNTYTIQATPVGFNANNSASEVDTVGLYLAGDTAAHNAADVCLNDRADGDGSSNGDLWELDNVESGVCAATSSNSTAYNFIWSDYAGAAAVAHNGATETGAADWANGYLVLDLALPSETWSK